MGCCCSSEKDDPCPPFVSPADALVLKSLELTALKLLGTGGSARVLAAKSSSSELVAVKIMDLVSPTLGPMEKSFQNEVRILQTLQTVPHPNVLEFVNSLASEDYYVLITHMYQGGDLYDAIANSINSFSERLVGRLIYQMVCALQHIHSMNIVHRDIKPENFVFATATNKTLRSSSEFQLRIIDFGEALEVEDNEVVEDYVGSLLYVAPEVLKREQMDGLAWKRADMWSLVEIHLLNSHL